MPSKHDGIFIFTRILYLCYNREQNQMGIWFGAVAGSSQKQHRKCAESADRDAEASFIIYYPQPFWSGSRQFIQQGFPKAGGIRLLGDLLTPRPLTIPVAVF